jgi:hypothetical protein
MGASWKPGRRKMRHQAKSRKEDTELEERNITQCYILFLGDYRGNTRERV